MNHDQADPAAGEAEVLNDPNDELVLKAEKPAGTVIATHTCRPAPEPDTAEWAECFRAFVQKVEEALRSSLRGGALLLFGALALCGLAACGASPELRASHDAFVAAYSEANADGVVTEAESAELAALFEVFVADAGNVAAGISWEEMLAAMVGTAASTFLGVNVYRNRSLPGSKRSRPPA